MSENKHMLNNETLIGDCHNCKKPRKDHIQPCRADISVEELLICEAMEGDYSRDEINEAILERRRENQG